ncbi:phage Gp37/Gp68 family protein [Rhizobium rhizogenes]|uniref:phage Gp37/Gp68 family protein n=1 Tax=Rhizobium rhizogenes TaxID=359 RepID=UPI0015727FBD|nr:phage Gp37/Gp68 family protein [Rhizobium rhizogenes]NTI27628.1 phage Gp37/Gp68 family protein [Rhizobium rhizogenes]
MADGTKIEWTDATWQIVTGCAVISPGCTNCYAMRLAGTRLKHHPSRKGLTRDTKAGPVWTGKVRFNEQWLDQPLRWKTPRMIFVAAHGDLFADGVTDEQLDQIFAVMALSPQHIFQVLTKRPERMREYLSAIVDTFHASPNSMDERFGSICVDVTASPCASSAFEDVNWPLPNVWLGFSAEDQTRFDARWQSVRPLADAGWLTWCSGEPLLGSMDIIAACPGICAECLGIGAHLFVDGPCDACAGSGQDWDNHGLKWFVAGGESGADARPMHPDWARSLRDQCASAGIPFLFKQWGNWQVACEANGHLDHDMARNDAHWVDIDGSRHKPSSTGLTKPFAMHRVAKSAAGRLLDGIEHNGFPPLPNHFKEQR